MLSHMEHTPTHFLGQHQALDTFLDARKKLLIDYIALTRNKKTLPTPEALFEFCSQLVDYVSAVHFEIYDYALAAYQTTQGNARVLAERIYPRLKESSVAALDFHDKYTPPIDEATLMELDNDLCALGEMLEVRFNLEDRLVLAISLLNYLSQEPADS